MENPDWRISDINSELKKWKKLYKSGYKPYCQAVIYYLEKMRDGICKASNKLIGELAYISTGTVANSLATLEKFGYIERFFKDEKKRHRERIETRVKYVKFHSTMNLDTPHNESSISPDTPHNEQIRNKNNKEENKYQKGNLEYDTAKYLSSKILAIHPDHKSITENTIQKWCKDIDYMYRLD